MFCCNRFFNLNTSCVPTCTTTCGPTVVVTCNDCCARVCSNVTFTVTITNTATCTINCASLHVLLPRAFCFNRGTVTVNGTAQENTVPECINIGTIEPSATVTITYRVTIMECKRYTYTKAILRGAVCCCCENKNVCIPSNNCCLQVCCCCGNLTTTGTTPTTPDTPNPGTTEGN